MVDLSNDFVMREAGRVCGMCWEPEDARDLDRLYELIVDPERGMPLYILTEPDKIAKGYTLPKYVLEHNELARSLQGLGYVVTMPWSLGFEWTQRVGKHWSVFLGAVRTYMPGCDFENDSPAQHPRALIERILSFRYRGEAMERAFSRFLVDRALEFVATRRVNWGSCTFYLDAKRRAAARGVASAGSADEKIGALEAEVESLKQLVQELGKEAEEYSDDAMAADAARKQAEEDNERLRLKVDALSQALSAKSGESVDAGVELPTAYDDLAEWIEKQFTGRLVLHSRALRGIKAAQYLDLEKLCQALLLLANEYRDMRLGLDGARTRFEQMLEAQQLRCDGSISETRAGEQGDTYFIRYPYPTSPKRLIDTHLRSRGNTRDPDPS